MLRIRVTRNRFGLTTCLNYAVYTAIDRLARNAVHLSFLRSTCVEPFSNRSKIHHESFALPLFVSLPLAVGRHLFFAGSVCQNSPDRRDDRALKYVAPAVSHPRFSPFLVSCHPQSPPTALSHPLVPSGIPQGERHRH